MQRRTGCLSLQRCAVRLEHRCLDRNIIGWHRASALRTFNWCCRKWFNLCSLNAFKSCRFLYPRDVLCNPYVALGRVPATAASAWHTRARTHARTKRNDFSVREGAGPHCLTPNLRLSSCNHEYCGSIILLGRKIADSCSYVLLLLGSRNQISWPRRTTNSVPSAAAIARNRVQRRKSDQGRWNASSHSLPLRLPQESTQPDLARIRGAVQRLWLA